MNLKQHFVSLAGNNLWSNHRLLAACRLLPGEDYLAPRRSFFGSTHAALDHILMVDLLYLDRLRGTRSVDPDRERLATDLPDLSRRQEQAERALPAFCQAQDHDTLAATISFTRANGQSYTEVVAHVLTHLFLHQVHHRGQVHAMLSQTAVPPPQLDEFFLAGDAALRREEVEELGLDGALPDSIVP